MENNITALPEIGKVYPFYDDGKIGMSRQYLAMVIRIIPFNSNAINKTICGLAITNDDEMEFGKYNFYHPLKQYWEYNVNQFDWVFSKETDYLIECAIPDYDEHILYFARTTKGKWFSLEIQNDWQSGLLDIEGINNEYLLDELKEKLKNNQI